MLQGKYAVVLSRNARGSAAIEAAKAMAARLGVAYLDRPHNQVLEDFMAAQGLAAVIVLEKDGPRIHSEHGTFSYHPGMAEIRVQQLLRGAPDHLVKALDLKPGAHVLDCTLGLASDAAVAACVVGAAGRVVGLEASLLLHFAVEHGLAHYECKTPLLTAALRRVEAVHAVAAEYLAQCVAKGLTFDVVYFDPMFRHPVQGSKAMEALRPLSLEEPLAKSTVELALKVAPRVVIKERSEYLLAEYGCTEYVGGKYSRIKFGIIRR
ncbi:MAG: class I SAM-dependent methyltransferase [Phascolarctobacterium sp.]|nr:class I SAM-dependent methyltransferase [Phascolarctobacterium sp.]